MTRTTAIAMFALLGLSTGCSEDEVSPGSALVKWIVKGSTCDKADIADVRVDLLQEGAQLFSEGGKCSAGQVTFDVVPPGVYDVRVLGFDALNNPTYEGLYSGLSVKEGAAPSSPPSAITLNPRKGSILLAWKFPNDKSNLCSFNNVSEIEVNVAQTGTVVQHFSGIFPCEPAYADPEELPAPLENGWIVLSDIPPGEADVVLFGLSPEGDRIFSGTESVNVHNIGYVQVTVELEPCTGGCI